MKKIYALILIYFATAGVQQAQVQFLKLHDFAGTDGSAPWGAPLYDSSFLYGMTTNGGANSKGVIYKIKYDGSNYTKLLDFAGSNGNYASGSLIADNTYLYGMTEGGGTNNMGVIFKIKRDGTGYTKLLDFAGTANGSYPYGDLLFDGTYLYGMTSAGGANNMGTVFKILPNGTGYTKLLDFSGSNGNSPYGSLISDGTFLYGMTFMGGANNSGVVFKIMTNGTGYVDLLDFAGSNGSMPNGSLISDGTFLYGMTTQGGANGNGTIFKIMPDGSGYVDLLDFAGSSNGSTPYGSLAWDGNYLYGMTSDGGSIPPPLGTLFKIKTDGTGYVKLYQFGNNSGGVPRGTPLVANGMLYGTASTYGLNSMGTIFKLCLALPMVTTSASATSVCLGSSVTLSGAGASTYTWTGGITNGVPFTPSATQSYTVTGADTNNCSNTASITVNVNTPASPDICMITADSLSLYNYIYWDKTLYTGVDSFIFYREDVGTSTYLKIGAVSKDSFSVFIDTARSIGGPNGGHPQYSSWRYKMAVLDTCGNIGAKSPYHQTSFLQDQQNGNFNWNAYTVEAGQPNPVTGYSFLRDDNNTGAWHILVNTSALLATDPNYFTYQYIANWRVDALGFNCTPTMRYANGIQGTVVKSKSNISNNRAVGVKSSSGQNAQIVIHPNPNSGIFYLNMRQYDPAKGNKVEVYNVFGEKVYSDNILAQNMSLNISELPAGIYQLHVLSNNVVIYQSKVVKQ